MALGTTAIELAELGESSDQVAQSLESLGASHSDAQAAAEAARPHVAAPDQASTNIANIDDVAQQARTLNPEAPAAPQQAEHLAEELQQALPDAAGQDPNFAAEAQQGLENEARDWYPDNVEVEDPLNGVDDQGQAFDNPLNHGENEQVFENPLHADPTNPSPNPIDFGKIADGVAAAGLTGAEAAAATQVMATSKAAGGDVSQEDTATQLVDIGVTADQAQAIAKNIGESDSDVAALQKSVDDTSKQGGPKSTAQTQDAIDAQSQLLAAESSAPQVGVAQGFVSALADRVIGEDSKLSAAGVKLKDQLKGDAVQLKIKWGTKIKDKLSKWVNNLATPKAPTTGVSTSTPAVPNSREAGNLAYLSNPYAQPDIPEGHTDVSYSPTDDRELYNGDNPFASDVDSSHAAQGDVGDCWFASVLQNIADRDPEFIKNQITVNHTADGTTYTIPFYPKGSTEPVNVTVDGSIPLTDDERTKYMGTNTGPTWPAIYEKAAAKFFSFTSRNNANGYDSLQYGYESDALQAIAGPHQKNQYVKQDNGTYWAQDKVSANPGTTIGDTSALWDKLTKAVHSDTGNPRDNIANAVFYFGQKEDSTTAIYPAHSCSIVDTSEQNGTKMVTISNPHNENLKQFGINEKPGPNGEITLPYDEFIDKLEYVFF